MTTRNSSSVWTNIPEKSAGTILTTRRLKVLFEYSDGPYSTPLFTDGRIVTVGAQGLFNCFTENGEWLWSRNFNDEFGVAIKKWPITTSPIAFDGQVVFNLGSPKAGIVGIDLASGEILWSATDHSYSYSSPIVANIHEKTLVFSMTENGLVCLEPHSGEVLWDIEHRLRQEDRANAVSPIVIENKVCIVTGPSVKPGFRCFEIQPDGSYTEPWKNIRLLNSQYTNLAHFKHFFVWFHTSQTRRT